MEIMLFVSLFIFITAISLLAHWVDKKHNLQLGQWFNCEVSSPFKTPEKQSSKQEDELYDALKMRVETLEKIVTDPATELNDKINKL